MRKLQLKNQSFIYIEKSFREWLDILGYAESTVYNLPNHIRELFYFLESHGHSDIKQLTPQLIKDHYENLKLRSNDRKGGALSNGSLNKHLQALYKFTDYLRQSGRMILPTLQYRLGVVRRQRNRNTYATEKYNYFIKPHHFILKTSNTQNHIIFLNAIALRDCAMLTVFYGCGLTQK